MSALFYIDLCINNLCKIGIILILMKSENLGIAFAIVV